MAHSMEFTNVFKIMENKKWKPIYWFECPECRGELEGFTEAEDDFFYDGDIIKCTNCEWVGEIIINGEAWVKKIGLYNDNQKKSQI